MPDHEAKTVLSNSRGEAWTDSGFSTVWHSFKTALENEGLIEKGLTLRGLRHTLATTLREAGLDECRIADLLGQKTPPMARHYSRSANLADKNRETMATLEEENRRRAESAKPSQKRVKPDRNETVMGRKLIHMSLLSGARGRNRTTDTRIFNPLLYP